MAWASRCRLVSPRLAGIVRQYAKPFSSSGDCGPAAARSLTVAGGSAPQAFCRQLAHGVAGVNRSRADVRQQHDVVQRQERRSAFSLAERIAGWNDGRADNPFLRPFQHLAHQQHGAAMGNQLLDLREGREAPSPAERGRVGEGVQPAPTSPPSFPEGQISTNLSFQKGRLWHSVS